MPPLIKGYLRVGAKIGSTAELEAWLLAGEEGKLAACFQNLLLGTLLSAMLAWAAWRCLTCCVTATSGCQ